MQFGFTLEELAPKRSLDSFRPLSIKRDNMLSQFCVHMVIIHKRKKMINLSVHADFHVLKLEFLSVVNFARRRTKSHKHSNFTFFVVVLRLFYSFLN